jgi:hypothetical protein
MEELFKVKSDSDAFLQNKRTFEEISVDDTNQHDIGLVKVEEKEESEDGSLRIYRGAVYDDDPLGLLKEIRKKPFVIDHVAYMWYILWRKCYYEERSDLPRYYCPVHEIYSTYFTLAKHFNFSIKSVIPNEFPQFIQEFRNRGNIDVVSRQREDEFIPCIILNHRWGESYYLLLIKSIQRNCEEKTFHREFVDPSSAVTGYHQESPFYPKDGINIMDKHVPPPGLGIIKDESYKGKDRMEDKDISKIVQHICVIPSIIAKIHQHLEKINIIRCIHKNFTEPNSPSTSISTPDHSPQISLDSEDNDTRKKTSSLSKKRRKDSASSIVEGAVQVEETREAEKSS